MILVGRDEPLQKPQASHLGFCRIRFSNLEKGLGNRAKRQKNGKPIADYLRIVQNAIFFARTALVYAFAPRREIAALHAMAPTMREDIAEEHLRLQADLNSVAPAMLDDITGAT